MNEKKTITIEVELTLSSFIGQKIKVRRNELGLTMSDLSDFIPYPFLSDVENGKRKIGFEKLYWLSGPLGVSMDWFVEGWDDVN